MLISSRTSWIPALALALLGAGCGGKVVVDTPSGQTGGSGGSACADCTVPYSGVVVPASVVKANPTFGAQFGVELVPGSWALLTGNEPHVCEPVFPAGVGEIPCGGPWTWELVAFVPPDALQPGAYAGPDVNVFAWACDGAVSVGGGSVQIVSADDTAVVVSTSGQVEAGQYLVPSTTFEARRCP